MAVPFISEYRKLLIDKSFIESELRKLPKGYISKKSIKGKIYHYLQYREDGKIVSNYIRDNDLDVLVKSLTLRKKYGSELPLIVSRIRDIEKAAKMLDSKLSRHLSLLKMSSGMDDLSREQRELSISFADAMTTIEGVEPGESTLNDLSEWRKGEKPFLMVLEETLIRYGFIVDEGNNYA